VRDPYEEMLRRGVVTRSGTALGMPGRLRITIGAPAECAALLAALESLVAAAA
jgi:histidinol-phosphate aminotransferase